MAAPAHGQMVFVADRDKAEISVEAAPREELPTGKDFSPTILLKKARKLSIPYDDIRPEEREFKLFGKPLLMGGEISGKLRGRSHFELDSGADDDEIRFSPEARLNSAWLPTPTVVVFASAEAVGKTDLYREGDGRDSSSDVSIEEAWLLGVDLFGSHAALQVGRVRQRDRREWWWDANLDAIRLHYFGSEVSAYAGYSEKVADLSTIDRERPQDRGLARSFAHLDWKWGKRQHLELFLLHQEDSSPRYAPGDIVERDRADLQDATLTWVGVRMRGCVKSGMPKRICYWGELAGVEGNEYDYDLDRLNGQQDVVDQVGKKKVDGWAYDVGISLQLPIRLKPYLTLGYAWGSGDRSGTPGYDGAFRQTGLHRNDGRFRGLTRFRYYGEVLRPELSNIAISTVALGFSLGEVGWIETIWHGYHQPEVNNRIAQSPIDEMPNGDSSNLGDELDLVVSYVPTDTWEFTLSGGAFRAGPAFGGEAGRWVGLIELELEYKF